MGQRVIGPLRLGRRLDEVQRVNSPLVGVDRVVGGRDAWQQAIGRAHLPSGGMRGATRTADSGFGAPRMRATCLGACRSVVSLTFLC